MTPTTVAPSGGGSPLPVLSPVTVVVPNTDGRPVGSGVSGQGGPIPDLTTEPLAYGQILASLQTLMPAMSNEDVEAMIAAVSDTLKNTLSKTDENRISVDSSMRDAFTKQMQKVMDDAAKKLKEAAADDQNVSVWDKIKQAFQYIGAAISIAVGAALMATMVGAVIGGFMITAGVLGLAMAANSTVESTTGAGILGNIAKAFGANPDQTSKADEGFGIALAIIGAACGVAAIATGAGADAFANLADDIQAMVQAGSTVGNVVGAAGTIVTAAGGIVTAAATYDASNKRADALSDQGAQASDTAVIGQLNAIIGMMIQHMGAIFQSFDASLSALTSMAQDTANTASHMAA